MVEITKEDIEYAAYLDGFPRHFNAVPHSHDRIILDNSWSIYAEEDDPIIRCGIDSLLCFFKKYCGFSVPVVNSLDKDGNQIRLVSLGETGEKFEIKITGNTVEVLGDSPSGVLYGTHRLQWLMSDNGGPYLSPAHFRVAPRADRRLTAAHFRQDPDIILVGDPLNYSDGYLDLMAHYGYNGIHFVIDLFDFMEGINEVPELNDPDAGARIERLGKLARRAQRYNIGIYLHVNAKTHSVDAPLFVKYPRLKGAATWSADSVCLCSSEPLTMRIYAETINNIIKKVPQVKGVITLIGGECLMHCYTRPFPMTSKATPCPRCGARKSSEVVAGFVNSIAGNVWEKNPGIDIIVWPYSGHRWSETHEQREFIDLLDSKETLLTEFENGAFIKVDGAKTAIFDYSISYVGPSKRYRVQRNLAKKNKLKFFAKTESSVTLELLNVPYIPVMENWQSRWNKMMSGDIDGVLANWHFVGLTGTLSEEVAYRETWKNVSGASGDATLKIIARRLAGEQGLKKCLSAWRLFSRAFSQLPFSPGLSGCPYFRGPMHLGPAHPLILFSEEGTRLPHVFFNPSVQDSPDGTTVTPASRKPLFFDDYRWTAPLGIERMWRRFEKVCSLWDKGMCLYFEALKRSGSARESAFQKEVDVAAMVSIILKSALYLARFQRERDKMLTGPLLDKEAEECYRRLKQIVLDDLVNARRGLELAGKDFRLGWGFLYGKYFTAKMIEMKIEFTENIVLPDLKQFYNSLIWHAFSRPPEIQ